MDSLEVVGYDRNNPEHILIICGDIFDRGTQPLEIYRFIKSLPRERRILIRGNHEELFCDMVDRKRIESHDKHNGTQDTLYQINGYRDNYDAFEKEILGRDGWRDNYVTYLNELEQKLLTSDITKEIYDWFFSDEWVNYYETEHYIFVHSFIPLKTIGKFSDYDMRNRQVGYMEDWRTNATDLEWSESRWGCPYELYLKGYFDKEIEHNKTLVCGHWSTADFWKNINHIDVELNESPLYISDKAPNLIGLDACTVLSYKVNVLVLFENEL